MRVSGLKRAVALGTLMVLANASVYRCQLQCGIGRFKKYKRVRNRLIDLTSESTI